MSAELQSVESIYFTSWRYVRIGGFNLGEMSSAGSGTSWLCAGGKASDDRGTATATDRIVQEGCAPAANFEETIYYKPYAPHGIRLVAQQPSKVQFTDRLGLPTDGWPGPISILLDEGKYKCWYSFLPDVPLDKRYTNGYYHGFSHYLCYAESADGFNWTKPDLGLVEYEGSRHNNILLTPYASKGWFRGRFGNGVFIDPQGDPAERYKMAYFARFSEDEAIAYMKKHPGKEDAMAFAKGYWGRKEGDAVGVAGAVSPDGIHWKHIDEPLLIAHSDSTINATFDKQVGKYVMYMRMWPMPGDSPESRGVVGRRSVGRCTSDDFRNWTKPEVLLGAGAEEMPSILYYKAGHTWLPGCDNQQVMFVNRWKQSDDTHDLRLFSTSDGLSWSAVPGGDSIVPTGDIGSWDGGKIYGGSQLVELPGGKWALPYQGSPVPHKYPRMDPDQRTLHRGVKANRGYAVWPKGRLVAMECPDVGSFATVAVKPAGDRLFLNASVEPAGYIKVEIRTLTANPEGMPDSTVVAGRTIQDCDVIWGKNGLEIPVTWKGQDRLSANGQAVTISFQLRRAKLFGLTFR